MDLSQITMSQTAPRNQFTYDQLEQDKMILRTEHCRRRLQALCLGMLAALKTCSGAAQRLLRDSAQMAIGPFAAK